MNALDQAFIRAYRQDDATCGLLPPVESPSQQPMIHDTNSVCFDTLEGYNDPWPAPAELPCLEQPEVVRPSTPTEVEQSTRTPTDNTTVPPETEIDSRSHSRSVPPVRSPKPGGQPFRPLLQVDGFVWPKVCRKLSVEAHSAMNRLADGLIAGSANECKVVAFASCLRGEGSTTLLLSVAQRLAERNVNMLMLDADPLDPSLARRVGLLPDLGWQEVLIGQVPLAEAVVGSVEDHVALLPSCGPSAEPDPAVAPMAALGPVVAQMRRAFTLLLIDLGPLDQQIDSELNAAAQWIDAVLLISSVRATLPGQAVEARDRLNRAGVAKVGIVENFVNG